MKKKKLKGFEWNGKWYDCPTIMEIADCSDDLARIRMCRVQSGTMKPENALKPVDKGRQRAAQNRIAIESGMTPERKQRGEELTREFAKQTANQDALVEKYCAPLPKIDLN